MKNEKYKLITTSTASLLMVKLFCYDTGIQAVFAV